MGNLWGVSPPANFKPYFRCFLTKIDALNCYRFANSAEANGACEAVLAGLMRKGSSLRMGAVGMSRHRKLL